MCLTDLMLLADAYADASKNQSSSAQSPDAARAALVRALEAALAGVEFGEQILLEGK